MFSESSTGHWAVLQLPCCPSKQGGDFQTTYYENLRNKLPPQIFLGEGTVPHAVTEKERERTMTMSLDVSRSISLRAACSQSSFLLLSSPESLMISAGRAF